MKTYILIILIINCLFSVIGAAKSIPKSKERYVMLGITAAIFMAVVFQFCLL